MSDLAIPGIAPVVVFLESHTLCASTQGENCAFQTITAAPSIGRFGFTAAKDLAMQGDDVVHAEVDDLIALALRHIVLLLGLVAIVLG